MFASTITIPVLGQPHFLEAALVGLVKNSFYKHRIIILKSNPIAYADPFHDPQVRDWVVIEGQEKQVHASVDDMLGKRAAWLNEHDVLVIDVTEDVLAFRDHYRRGEIYPGKTDVEGGADIAFKNNVGLVKTDTEWTIPNWDADFYPGLHWDKPLVEYARSSPSSEKAMLVPMHVQPRHFAARPAWNDPWKQAREVAANVLTLPTTRKTDRDHPWVTEQEFFQFIGSMNKRESVRERPGARAFLHWVPAMIRTGQVRDVGGYDLNGCGYDILFDNKLGDRGFQKIGFLDSFILHKGYPPVGV